MKSTVLFETHISQENQEEEEEDQGGSRDQWLQKGKAKEIPTTPNASVLLQSQNQSQSQSHLELRLGISSLNNNNNNNTTNKYSCEARANIINGLGLNGLGVQNNDSNSKRWFAPPGDHQATNSVAPGFIHPWSLAARQKVAAEQASSLSVPRVASPLPLPIVGWPPVRACRRNLLCLGSMKSENDGGRDAKRAKPTKENEEDKKTLLEEQAMIRPTMFVKVNMEGFAVGRKINLKAHDSYESLSRALQNMFFNFLSINSTKNSAQEVDEVPNSGYILLYEDHEGDRMLVGDVPWELFISSVKRLYIAHALKKPKIDDEKNLQTRTERTAAFMYD